MNVGQWSMLCGESMVRVVFMVESRSFIGSISVTANLHPNIVNAACLRVLQIQ